MSMYLDREGLVGRIVHTVEIASALYYNSQVAGPEHSNSDRKQHRIKSIFSGYICVGERCELATSWFMVRGRRDLPHRVYDPHWASRSSRTFPECRFQCRSAMMDGCDTWRAEIGSTGPSRQKSRLTDFRSCCDQPATADRRVRSVDESRRRQYLPSAPRFDGAVWGWLTYGWIPWMMLTPSFVHSLEKAFLPPMRGTTLS